MEYIPLYPLARDISFPFHRSSIEQKSPGRTLGVGQVFVRRKGTQSIHLVSCGTMAEVQTDFLFPLLFKLNEARTRK